MSIKKCSFYLCNSDVLACSDHIPLQKIFSGNTDNKECNTWDLEAATIPRHVELKHIKCIANILADSVSRLKAVGLYHDLGFQKGQPDLGSPFEPLPPVKQTMCSPLELSEMSVKT